MPIISKIGARSWKVRAVYGAIYAVLLAGAVTMLYPLSLMLSGSVKSEADSLFITPYPRYWFDDEALFQKYVESKYNVGLGNVAAAWHQRVGSWTSIRPPIETDERLLAEFLEWRAQCPWWWLGHSWGGRMLPINSRLFRREMSSKYDGNIDALREDLNLPLKSWITVVPPPQPPGRYIRPREGMLGAFLNFADTRPVEDRIIPNLDANFWRGYLMPRYTHLAGYNRAHGTQHESERDIWLTRRAPADGLARKDWEEYVRNELPLTYIRLDAALADNFRRFLAEQRHADIATLNKLYKTDYRSFAEVPFSPTAPPLLAQQVDWEQFIKDAEYAPLDYLEVFGPRQAFEEFVAAKRGVPLDTVAPLAMPIAAADWHDMKTHSGALRWEFTTRNYKHVMDFIARHGRGILNTIIYCVLAIGTSLVVNPLAAYALSRYKPPSTYTILLFCMATMAFPGEVTMIPGFLLLKRFPLWYLLGAVATFFVVFWLLKTLLPKLSEMLHLTMALVSALVVAVWVVPLVFGDPTVSLLNSFAALVLPGIASGYSIFLLKGFFDSLPKELYEAAEIDGAGEWTKFWTITMSLSKPILAVIALGAFTAAYSAFMMALIIIPDQKMWTLMVWIFQLQSQSHPSVVYASLVIAAIPTFAMFVFCQKIIMRGIVVPSEK